ncbi:hypothetical protein FNF28_07625 [Cafeteria roenbergensis]|uniref:Aminotransferase class I/classII large domain-containing protein n=1 Tax=Cafeteria roenbergensis TaxID=33653 RepID=A0A5A8C1E3_CAFRO|nr:hypothetical protein FNF28_07625 [Cafeteria roenbergensis]
MPTSVPVESYASFLNTRAARRKPSPIRALQAVLATAPAGLISLGGGMPNPALFPFSGISVTLRDGTVLSLSEESVRAALQYSPTPGIPELVSRLERVQRGEHSPPGAAGDRMAVMVGTGSQDLLAKAFDTFLDEETPVVIEAPTYSGTLAALEPIGCPLITIPSSTDGTGIDVGAVEELAAAFESGERAGPRPRLIYVIPTAGNPTGATMPLENRRRLYAAARRLGSLIIEDDPYRFLDFGEVVDPADADADAAAAAARSSTPVARTPSLLSMDEDGRVLRFDSFSKLLSAGLRIGTVTGPKELVDALGLHAQASCLHTSGVSQALVLELFRHWGVGDKTPPAEDGSARCMGDMEAHIAEVASFYRSQRDACIEAINKHLRDPGLAELYAVPSGGMFAWIKVPGLADTTALVKERAAAAGVLFVPGSAFVPGGGSAHSAFVRASFSVASHEQLDESIPPLRERDSRLGSD